MTIFNEYRNKYLTHTVELINKVAGGTEYSEQDIRDSFRKNCFNEVIFDYVEALLNVSQDIESNFDVLNIDDKKRVKLRLNTAIPNRPLSVELNWLANMFEDKRIHLFLSGKTIAKLSAVVKEKTIPATRYSQYIDVRNRYNGEDDVECEKFIHDFKLLYSAIQNKKVIKFSNIDAQGNKHENCKGVPFRIEYSILEEKFRVSIFSLDGQRPIKTNISRMYDIFICTEQADIDWEQMLAAIDKRKVAEPLIMEVKNEKNVIERCFALFSCYERQRAYIREDGLYILEVGYYEFEKKEIVNKILTLGAAVRVINSSNIKNEIKMRLSSQAF